MNGKRRQISPVGSPPSDSESNANIGTFSDTFSKEQDKFLPIANVSRIMKKSLPANAKISKEAKETVQECVSEFISFITGEASDKCQREKRKTINGDDLLWAMTTLGFDNYVGPLKVYLNKYRETEGEKITVARQDDHAITEETGNSGSTDELNKVITNSIATTVNLPSFNGGFYTPMAPVIPRSFGDHGERVMAYGENMNMNMNMGVYHMGKIHENGDGNANCAIANHHHHHHGVQW